MVKVAIAQFDGATTMRAPPLAAGLLAATLRAEPSLVTSITVYAARRDPDAVAHTVASADVLGISLYTWNQRYSLEVARRARALSPALRIIAGGPSVPRRPDASSAFLAQYPWLDALVLGEGERAFVDIVGAVRDGRALAGIEGVVAPREGPGEIGAPRRRLAGDAFAGVGSPYLDGTFDELVARGEIAPIGAAVVETNRGCPFACTFCDWGQATQSKVNELPLERVERELAWLAERGVPYLYLVDANFGIRRRDEELTRTIGKLARMHASPRFVFFHLTKNATTKNLRTVEILREHGVATQVALSMQDFDADVLLAIKRDNIRPTDALDLRARCHAQDIPTHNELMLGLPAQTASSIRRSVSAAITPFPNDSFFLYPTRVLDNAELAEPTYRARFGIETRIVPTYPPDPAEDPFVLEHEELVVATRALPVDAWRDAYAFGFLLAALWNQRVLQTTIHVATFALGIPVPALIDALLAATSPRLSAIRTELARFSESILAARATTLAIEGWGTRRREPIDGVCARILEEPEAFYAEVADVAATLVATSMSLVGDVAAIERGDAVAMLRDATRWDALQIPHGDSREVDFAFDWLAYGAAMGARPIPLRAAMHVRSTSWPTAMIREGQLDGFLGLGWAKLPRGAIERV
ncbi:MAG: radical SAM protein [Kofleriaceae bacterium]